MDKIGTAIFQQLIVLYQGLVQQLSNYKQSISPSSSSKKKEEEEWWKQFSVTDEAIFIWTKGQNTKKNHKMCGLDLTPLSLQALSLTDTPSKSHSSEEHSHGDEG